MHGILNQVASPETAKNSDWQWKGAIRRRPKGRLLTKKQ